MDLPARRRHDRRPEKQFEQLRDAFADQLERWPDFVRSLPDAVRDVVPLADVEERDDSYVLEVELPGVKRDEVDLEVDQGRVRVTAERRERERVGLLRHRTRSRGRFSMAVTLPTDVDSDAVSATLDHGVLTIVVPKTERARRRRIPVGRP